MKAKGRKPDAKPAPDDWDAKTTAQKQAAYVLYPVLNAAGIMESFNIHDKPDLEEIVEVLDKRCHEIAEGDTTKRIERLLIAQAYALDSMFASLARRAKNQHGLPQFDAHMKFALRAQSQCRATLETLAAIKNPPNVAFVKQANIAHGPQQVNNGQAQPVARVEEKTNPPTELLEHDHAQRLDTGTASAASAGDPIMATVGTLDRATHGTRKGRIEP
jgi:hypothetical protein